MSTLPVWLLKWAELERSRSGQHSEADEWIRILESLKDFQDNILEEPFRSMTTQELLAIIYQPWVRKGFSINTKHGGLRPPVTLTRVSKRVSMKQFLPALVDVLQKAEITSFRDFIHPLMWIMSLSKDKAMDYLSEFFELNERNATSMPRGIPKPRRSATFTSDSGGINWSIRPGQFGTSGQSRRAFVLDTLAAQASLDQVQQQLALKGLGIPDDLISRILESLRPWTSFGPGTRAGRDVASESYDGSHIIPNGGDIIATLHVLRSLEFDNPGPIRYTILGLIYSADADLARLYGDEISAVFAEKYLCSGTVEGWMKKIKKHFCHSERAFLIPMITAIGFPIDTCGSSGSSRKRTRRT